MVIILAGGMARTGAAIDKFPFTSDANATDVGDLTVPRYNSAGQSSSESGYTSGGRTGFARNTIDKFPFSTDANATDVGDLTLARYYPAGQSDVVNGFGYTSGGDSPPGPLVNVIDKFPFSLLDANATDVGDLSSNQLVGAQVKVLQLMVMVLVMRR